MIAETKQEITMTQKLVFSALLAGCSFLVYNLAGWNYFLPSEYRIIVKLIVAFIFLTSSVILYNWWRASPYFSISFAFFSISVGLLCAWVSGNIFQIVAAVESPEVWAILKLIEALPIVIVVLILAKVIKDDWQSMYLQGGDIKQSLKLGILISPLSIVQFVAMGGLSINVDASTIITWIPWLILFSFTNSFMEELIFRGLILRKYEVVLGERESLILISLYFAVFHAVLLPFMGVVLTVSFVSFLFFVALLWGYSIQKTNCIWGAVLAHAIADILFVIAAFGVV
jgi:membrane protease YdiL (CAAX protease family)